MRFLRPLAIATLLPLLLATTAGAQLQAEWLTQKTTFSEGRHFTLRLQVTNTTFGVLEGVGVSDVIGTGTGHADMWSWPKPAVKDLGPLQSVVFKLRMQGQLAGDVVISAVASAASGDSTGPVATSTLLIRPRKVRRTATTDAWGAATVRLGKTKLRVRLVDEDTGHPLAGLSLSASPIPKTPRAHLVLVADPLGRVPVQTIRVMSPPGVSTQPAPPGEEPSPDLPPAEPETDDPVDLPVFPGDGPFAAGPMRTVLTSRLGTKQTAAVPPADGRYAEAWLRAAKAAAKAAGKGQLKLPPELGPDLPDVTDLPAFPLGLGSEPQVVPNGLDAIRAAVESATSGGSAGALLLTAVDAEPNGALHKSPVATIDLFDPRIEVAESHALQFADELRLRIVRWGELAVVLVHPRMTKKSKGAPAPLPKWSFLGVNLVGPGAAPADDAGLAPPIFSGTFALDAVDVLGRQLVTVIGPPATDGLLVPEGSYTATARRPFHEPWCAPFSSVNGGVQIIDVFQDPSDLHHGELSTTDPVEFLPAFQAVTTETLWLDGSGMPTVCADEESLLFFGDPDVAEVVGQVALSGDGCGAGRLVALCGRRQTTPLRISTDCGGKLPPSPPASAGPQAPPNEQAGTYTGVVTVFAVAELPGLCTWNVAYSLGLSLVLAGSGQPTDPYVGTLTVGGSYHETLVDGPGFACSVTPAAILAERSGPVTGNTGTVNASVTGAAIPFYAAMVLSGASFDEDGRLLGTLTVKTGSNQIQIDPAVTLTLEP